MSEPGEIDQSETDEAELTPEPSSDGLQGPKDPEPIIERLDRVGTVTLPEGHEQAAESGRALRDALLQEDRERAGHLPDDG